MKGEAYLKGVIHMKSAENVKIVEYECVAWDSDLWFVAAITLVNKDFVPWEKKAVSDVFLDAEFKYVSRISLSATPFAECQ